MQEKEKANGRKMALLLPLQKKNLKQKNTENRDLKKAEKKQEKPENQENIKLYIFVHDKIYTFIW